MKRTDIAALIGTAGFFAAAALILVRRFYGSWQTVSIVWALPLWAVGALCVFLAVMVRRRRDEGRVGLDRSQLNPMMVANFLVIGKSGAWAGAVLGGWFLGLTLWVVPRINMLAAAEADAPGVLAGLAGAVFLSVAGVILERSCEVSPPNEGEGAG
ncbi:DUF3180 domain-containing protein [Corynebacterium genitalium ATCC 33030]|uniref:DUF3180 domain-containing protein n=1 Tax=Corynebacterium genitalium ATCC 33030 TaxID=585529 RepID=D7W9Z2_9CORY|nr:DUF3180 domain-containing protein [Corynebacterium genitalium]EFK55609.1 hypothetical protein HMPREF0291_10867 [Corynebacterium genitalium ATCC 33030]MCQ4621271.1 DUF3180 domain-containing protein [Corynebacterium sp. CCUG 71335]MCQ4627412.1 DUF3180 domain-containing protein [Corynebacterium sp. CCUG 65737]UUA89170.1 DUF3180 domain-containing protein [Corynebacterium genitalium ATCC 33030]